MHPIIMYSDGACSGNPGPGGWGVCIILNKKILELYGSQTHTTNNRMELTGAIEGLKSLKESSLVELYTDSRYVQLGVTAWVKAWIKNNWRTSNKQDVKNIDLWKELIDLTEFHTINWYWVKGHSQDKYNLLADSLAVKGRDEASNMLLDKKIKVASI